MEIRRFAPEQLSEALLDGFAHEQKWDGQWIRTKNGWKLVARRGERIWSEGKRRWIPEYLREQIARGGCAFGAYEGEQLVGFASVDGVIVHEHANLTMLFADDRFQRRGVGRALLEAAKGAAQKMGAQGLYISAIPAEQTIAFYMAMRCRDAEPIPEFVDSPEDRPLQLAL